MQYVDYIIVGQGMAGSWLAFLLVREKKSIIVFDEFNPAAASLVMSGVINPVSGRRPVKAWMIDDILSVIPDLYAEAEAFLHGKFFFRQDILKFFPNEETRHFFLTKYEKKELPSYVQWLENDTMKNYLHVPYGGVRISPAYRVDSAQFIQLMRTFLKNNNMLREEKLFHDKLQIHAEHITYQQVKAKKIIFCEGYKLLENPLHRQLPLYANKGEYLIVKITGFPTSHTIQARIGMVPVKNDIFWIGSDYQLQYENELPTPSKRVEYENILKQLLKTDYVLIDHGAGIRPTVSNERRPFVGIYPASSPIAILNGLGAKGASYAPYFALQLVNHLLYRQPLNKEADVARYC